ncbi:MAG TPA: response regulator transcription factor [Deinococcales bacterium]|nr:response regulator transcription factor [Deinococcales bacterium]
MKTDMPLILVVEDEREIADILEKFLRQRGFDTEWARDGEEALALFRQVRPDLVLLDLLLPRRDGLEVMKEIRRAENTPVIMLTARSEEIDKVLGLELGADDYITKPFRPLEVVARINAVLRRSRAGRDEVDLPLRAGGIEVDEVRALALVRGERLQLTTTEFRLLQQFVAQPGRVFSRQQLLEAAMPESDALERVVDVHIGNLRRKLAAAGLPDVITTVRGMGFRLDVE